MAKKGVGGQLGLDLPVTDQNEINAAKYKELITQARESQTIAVTPSEGVTPFSTEALSDLGGITPEPSALETMDPEERERQRTPSFQENLGLAPDMRPDTAEELGLNTLKDVIGEDFDRIASNAVRMSNEFNPIGFSRVNTEALGDQPLTTSFLAEKYPAKDGEPILSRNGPVTKLNAASVFLSDHGLQAGIRVNPEEDIRGFKLAPQFNIVMSALVEKELYTEATEVDPNEGLSEEAREEIEGEKAFINVPEDTSKGDTQRGRVIFQEWRRAKAYMEGIPTDSYVDDYENLSEESFALIGALSMDLYHLSNPSLLTRETGEVREGTYIRSAPEYMLTEPGLAALEKSTLYNPIITKPPAMRVPSPTGQFLGEARLKTRPHMGQGKDRKGYPSRGDEAAKNAHSVANYVDVSRAKIIYLFGVAGLMANYQRVGRDTPPAAFLGIGKDRMDKIKTVVEREKILLAVNSDKLDSALIAAQYSNDYDYVNFLQGKIKDNEINIKLYTTKKWQDDNFRLYANKQLQELIQLSYYDDGKPHYHSYTLHRGNQRLHVQQSAFSPQGSPLLRSAVSSGSQWSVTPGSNSNVERAFLEKIGSVLLLPKQMIPEAYVREVRNIVNSESGIYKEVVRVGAILEEVIQGYDSNAVRKSLKDIKITKDGIVGIDKIPLVYPEPLFKDAGVKSFIESAAEHPREFPVILEAAMELAKYHKAKQEGRSFQSSMNGAPIDGISNGLANMLAVLGLEDKMYRVGVLRVEGSEDILGSFSESGSIQPAYKGDLRVVLDKVITEISGMLLTEKTFTEEYGIDKSEISDILTALNLALEDRENFKKVPVLTFSYGQEMKNVISTVYTTILSRPELKIRAEQLDGGIPRMSKILHGILANGVALTLGKEIVELTDNLRTMIENNTLVGMETSFRNPSGSISILGKKDMLHAESTSTSKISHVTQEPFATKSDPRVLRGRAVTEQAGVKDSDIVNKPRAISIIPKKRGLNIFKAKKEGSFLGGVVRGQGIPFLAQNFDGAVINSMFSNAVFNKMQADKPTWFFPVFDELLSDLGSFNQVRETANKTWMNTTSNFDILGDMARDYKNNIKAGLDKLKETADKSLEEPLRPFSESERAHAEYVMHLIDNRDLEDMFIDEFRNLYMALLYKGESKLNTIEGTNAVDRFKYQRPQSVLYAVVKQIVNETNINISVKQFANMADKARERRKSLKGKVTDPYQYTVDIVNFKLKNKGNP